MNLIQKRLFALERSVRRIGYEPRLSGHEKRKLGIFNLLNAIFGITLGIFIPVTTALGGTALAAPEWCLLSGGPLLVTAVTLFLNLNRRYEAARTTFFLLHPLLLALIYILKIDLGTDLFFICYGVLSVFFLQNIQSIIFTFSVSLTCYFLSLGLVKTAGHNIQTSHIDFYLLNQLLAIFFIFYGIFIIRNENSRYQFLILDKNRELREQAIQLTELNSLKNTLFSVISHDLRGPLYAMQTLFNGIVDLDSPAEEIRALMPLIARDLGETTGNIENLLQWARTQMQAETVDSQMLDIGTLIGDVLGFLRLQVDNKRLRVETDVPGPVFVYADKEMINLVLRNLLSNAIKFTPESGTITVGATETRATVEIFVRDTGMGISSDALQKMEDNILYSTRGTDNESGSGLGLMLCREFLSRNGGRLLVKSQPGKGSTFSFVLPRGLE